MPELPEVETVVRDLRQLLAGRRIAGIRQSKKKLRRPWQGSWNAAVTGARIEGVRRRGKWILVDLQHSAVLRLHLGMSGQLTAVTASKPEPDHVHVVFELDGGKELRFRDPRRFGSAEYFVSRDEVEAEMNAELGPEPFGMDAVHFRDSLRASTRIVKAILMDQRIVAGVGNIYADEALFRARLHPRRRGTSLTGEECDHLRVAVAAVMSAAIESGGSTIRDYIGGSGLRGGFQNKFAVYSRTGEPCRECKTPIASLRLGGRSSHFCPRCQPKPKGVRGRESGVGKTDRAQASARSRPGSDS